jgi:hypothetical protein
MSAYAKLSLGARTAYAELFDQAQSLALQRDVRSLAGSFQKKKIRNRSYWYCAYRDIDGGMRFAYVGPDTDRIAALVTRFRSEKRVSLGGSVRAAIALGCASIAPPHYRIIKRLADYGFFRAGGLLIGTHAFVALGNLLGVRWGEADKTLAVDFTHAGRNVSLALPATVRVDVHAALVDLDHDLLRVAATRVRKQAMASVQVEHAAGRCA